MRYQRIRGGSRFVVDGLVSGSSLVWENRGMRMIAKQNLPHSPTLLDCATRILRSLGSCKKCITLDLGGCWWMMKLQPSCATVATLMVTVFRDSRNCSSLSVGIPRGQGGWVLPAASLILSMRGKLSCCLLAIFLLVCFGAVCADYITELLSQHWDCYMIISTCIRLSSLSDYILSFSVFFMLYLEWHLVLVIFINEVLYCCSSS